MGLLVWTKTVRVMKNKIYSEPDYELEAIKAKEFEDQNIRERLKVLHQTTISTINDKFSGAFEIIDFRHVDIKFINCSEPEDGFVKWRLKMEYKGCEILIQKKHPA